MFFKSASHTERFISTMMQIGKIDDGAFNPEYAAAIYLLTADAGTWNKASTYVSDEGLDLEGMLKKVDFSSGYTTLMKLAGNLFNGNTHVEPLDFLGLDERNFHVALTALQIRRYGFRLDH